MNQKKMPTEKTKSSRTKRSKQGVQEKETDPGSLNSSLDFLNELGERVPADRETDIMLSTAIMNIARPFTEKYDSRDQHVRTIINLAVGAWNLTLIPKKHFESAIKNIESELPMDSTMDEIESVLQIFFQMVQNKLQNYPKIKHYIDRCELVETEDGWNLRVLSIIMMNAKSDMH